MLRKKRTAFAVLLAICLLLSAPPAAAYSDLPEVDIQSRSAILVHAQTDEVLFSHNIHIRREPASITKVMTALLALEHSGLDDVVTAEEGDFFDIIAGGSNAGIKAGEEMTLRDLIYCAMLPSANEACNVIARHVAGSVEAFMEMMNARLADIGCENTQFTNTHGLPDPEHYTTAYDTYLMARECLNNPEFMEIANTEYITLAPTNMTPDGRALTTTNNLITRRRFPDYIYPYARGIKTGRTNNAGHCLLSTAERDGITLISVVLGASVDEETNLIRSFTETRDLFEWGFANFTMKRILSRVDKLIGVKVIQGKDETEVYLVPERSVEALVPKTLNPEDIDRRITVFEPEGVQAPVTAGTVLGEVKLSYQGHDYGTIPLLADRSVERDTREFLQSEIAEIISRDWIRWVVISVAVVAALYILIAITLNRRRRMRNMRASNYRGRKRY
ncbi:MAG: D-alanyl-D-alanine carboxypeptidase [Oscillospiraceae bacterium]|jgi:D-alanyl-D-alanine carboxypeptidase (penicillin-binding protein 5/6)|nr:D-alanyl-D-alanine carboxypeptidase [Oscillospiraceae bacterium]